MASLTDLTIAQLGAAMAKKEASALEVADAHLGKLDEHRALNAFITETPDKAREMAKASDARRAKGEVGLLEGVPLAIKDLFCTEGVQTTAASHILEGFVPPYESTVTANLWKAGATMVGKTNLDEFAMGSSNMTSHFGGVENPWKRRGDNRKLVPGGSSGGSAAAVAAYMVPGSTGTDTGGSIRQPASFCGIVGMKPTYGRCSRWGVVAFASSLDQPGPLARTVEDAAILLQAMSGHDPKDSTSAPLAVPDFASAARNPDIKGLRGRHSEGVPRRRHVARDRGTLGQGRGDAEGRRCHGGRGLAAAHQVRAAGLLHRGAGRMLVEPRALRRRALRPARTGQGPHRHVRGHARRGLRQGSAPPHHDRHYVLSAGYYDAYYKKAQQIRALIARDFKQAFEKCDVLLTPTAPTAAFAAGDKMDDPVTMYLNDMFTIPASMAGLPGISVPAGVDRDGLPLGLQILGRAFDEETVLKAGAALEKAAAFKGRAAGY